MQPSSLPLPYPPWQPARKYLKLFILVSRSQNSAFSRFHYKRSLVIYRFPCSPVCRFLNMKSANRPALHGIPGNRLTFGAEIMPVESGAPYALVDRLLILSPEKYDFKGQHFPEQLTHFPDQDNPSSFHRIGHGTLAWPSSRSAENSPFLKESFSKHFLFKTASADVQQSRSGMKSIMPAPAVYHERFIPPLRFCCILGPWPFCGFHFAPHAFPAKPGVISADRRSPS